MNVALHSSLESSIIRFSEQTKTKKSDIFFFICIFVGKNSLKIVSAIFYQIFIFHQMIALQ